MPISCKINNCLSKIPKFIDTLSNECGFLLDLLMDLLIDYPKLSFLV